ncbi:MAG TPA: 2-oxoglutarate dehydrogenase complex dihydrolipoyllysine-residue succinyltransferase [Ktedonobacteraceae bacterium]|jgi:2-oxoglutarate dehydrogenase E2 component (dihydrolipoamide succinyltransferase)|nr:2-oxoglutarate dehydrogenase complex dihydrolipoyllysine-residue succinyltransferase [Ktedonobacteraceae bacterium]
MSVEIRVPSLGESIVEATIATWLKHEGDAVRSGEALVELETDKVNVEVNAEQDGVLQQIIKKAGDEVAVGEVVGLIGEGALSQAAPAAPVAATSLSPQNGQTSTKVDTAALSHTDAQRPPSPLARRIAAEYNVDLSQVRGSSPHGRVTKEDVISYMEQTRVPSQTLPTVSPAPSAPPVPTIPPAPPRAAAPSPTPSSTANGRPEERVRMSRRRQTIAQRLVEAQHTAAMLTTFNEVDMSAIIDIRTRRKDAFKERHEVSLGFMSFFTKAVVGALKVFPRLNAEIQGNDMLLKQYYDIGIAVGAEEGLVVPVVRDADRKGFAQIEREIADYAKRARANTLGLADLQGGTFTITNGGIFGSLLSTPILNGPQVGILGMHKIEQRPIALNGQVVIRPMMYLALSYDHRIVDGSEAVRFLVRVKELLEDPESLLIEG